MAPGLACGSCATSWSASRTSTSPCSLRRTSCGTAWSGRSSTPTAGGTTSRASTTVKEVEDSVSVDVLNETDHDLDPLELVALSRYVMAQMKVHPGADLCLRLVDEAAMEVLHVQW